MQEKSAKKYNIDRAVMGMAGSFVLVSVLLGLLWSPWWFAFTLFVGANLLQASFTGFCPAAIIFHKLGLGYGCAFKGNNGQ
jgi:hypothetical protein